MKYFAATKLSENIHVTPEGFLLALGVPIARTGTQKYGRGESPIEVGEDGFAIVERDEEQVFALKTIASFEGKPLTIQHPDDFVNPTNAKRLTVGHMQNVRRGDQALKNDLLADILVTDQDAISLVKGGMRELSCGYECEYEETGTGRGRQVNIIGNHLALVDNGRAGPKYAIKDHKGDKPMSLKDKLLALIASEESAAPAATKTKTADESAVVNPGLDAISEKLDKVADLVAKMVNPAKVDAGDEKPGKQGKEAKAGDEEVASGLEERLAKLEALIAKILKAESAEAEVVTGDEDGDEETSDVDGDDEVVDEGEEETSSMTGDSGAELVASRAEILAPGIKMSKTVKVDALKKAYATKDGKTVIDKLTGGRAPAYDSKEAVDMVFNAAAELLKASRNRDLSKTKRTQDFQSAVFSDEGVMTPEKMNELNQKHYANKH